MANDSKKKYEPEYICWHENEFMGDRQVVRMTPHQRLMYRSLCQAAMFCSTRPYLSDDDQELYVLADADSLEQWMENREAVLVKFHSEAVDGKPVLAHKRLLADWDRIRDVVNQKRAAASKGGKARAKRMAGASQSDGCQTETETEGKPESETESKTEADNQDGEPRDSYAGAGLATNHQPKVRSSLAALFQSYVDDTADSGEFVSLLSCHSPQKIASVMRWAFTCSNWWGKDKDGEITSADQFVRAFPKIEEQYDKYYARAAKKPHEVNDDLAVPEMHLPARDKRGSSGPIGDDFELAEEAGEEAEPTRIGDQFELEE